MRADDIVRHICERIEIGELKAEERLPTHRNMAWDLNCSVGTVTRAYAELERRGITYAQVGRGTFVAGSENPAADSEMRILPFTPEEDLEGAIDLSINRFFHAGTSRAYGNAFHQLSLKVPQSGYRDYVDSRGRPKDLAYAASWLEHCIGVVDPSNIIVTQGAQSGLFMALGALTKPGDMIATEAYGYPGIKAAAQELHLRINALDMDAEGILPEAFETAVNRSKVKMLVTVATNHNPTGITTSLARRKMLIEIARKADIPIVEDGVYTPFHERVLPSYWELAPDISVFLTSFSKVFSPALRVGYAVAPSRYIPRLIRQIGAMNWMTSPVTLDLAAELLEDGTLYKHQKELIAEGKRRFAYAATRLAPWITQEQKNSAAFLSHFWVELPVNIALTDIIQQASDRNITLIGGDRFAMNRQQDAHFVRVCLMGVPNHEALVDGLATITDLLTSSETACLIS
jgi:DNA-binding transcriptional MocR family regulator